MACHFILFSFLFYLVNLSLSDAKSYDGYIVLTIKPLNVQHMNFLAKLDDPEYDFWKEPFGIGSSADLILPRRLFNTLRVEFGMLEMEYFIAVQNLQKEIDASERKRRNIKHIKSAVDFFQDFYDMDMIDNFMAKLHKTFPDLVETETIGYSYEKRPMTIIKVGTKKNTYKPIIWIDGGMIGREWVSSASALYIAYQLISLYGKDPEVTEIVDYFDLHILPVANPDGYHYSFTEDRIWRKNRKPIAGFDGQIGVDISRNFPYAWDSTSDRRTSNMSSPVYAGQTSLSENETQAIVDYLLKIEDLLFSYVTIQSARKAWLYPWSHTINLPDNVKETRNISEGVVNEINKRLNHDYKSDRAAFGFKETYGSPIDWAHGTLDLTHSYAFELRSHDKGESRFFIPSSRIIPISDDAWTGIKTMALLIKKNHEDAMRPFFENTDDDIFS